MSKSKTNGEAAAPAAGSLGLDGLDPLLHHRSRLGAMVLLSTAHAIPFSKLRELLEETDGNLGAQLRKLEEAKYLEANKAFVDRKPVTRYSITRAGHAKLREHLAAMEGLIRAAGK